jgi:ketosteroid isomerase-like protein
MMYPTMSKGAEIARSFYDAFSRRDAATMNAWYADHATFSDPVFPGLDARETRGMWDMLTRNARNFSLTYEVLGASDTHAEVRWIARYDFSRTGRPVENHVTTRMEIVDGRIVRQEDRFDFHAWARQALGLPGLLLGWTPFLRKKVQGTARAGLLQHLAVNPAPPAPS